MIVRPWFSISRMIHVLIGATLAGFFIFCLFGVVYGVLDFALSQSRITTGVVVSHHATAAREDVLLEMNSLGQMVAQQKEYTARYTLCVNLDNGTVSCLRVSSTKFQQLHDYSRVRVFGLVSGLRHRFSIQSVDDLRG